MIRPDRAMEAGDRDGVRNGILAALGRDELDRLHPTLSRVRLARGRVLHESGSALEEVYFVEEGLVSITAATATDRVGVEVSIVGREGLVGLSALLGDRPRAFHRAMVQIPGCALCMPVPAFRAQLAAAPTLQARCLCWLEASMALMAQHVACNATHSVAQRCARWLLLVRDRLGSDEVHLTHGFLSGMLAVRRAGVTMVLGELHREGLIRAERGRITVLDRDGLARRACHCYGLVADEFARLLGAPAPVPA